MKNDIPQTSSVMICYAISQKCLLLCSRKSEEKAGGRSGAPDSSAQPTDFQPGICSERVLETATSGNRWGARLEKFPPGPVKIP